MPNTPNTTNATNATNALNKKHYKKPVLMIHEWKSEFENIPLEILEKFILTLDDGLYSQYLALDYLSYINTPKIFFISTDIVRPENITPSSEIIHCADAHEKAFKGNFEDFMSWDEILEIYNRVYHNDRICYIGGHSKKHLKYPIQPLQELYNNLKKDTEEMIEAFSKHGIRIDKFCYPYNESYDKIYNLILKSNSIKDIYGKDRLSIEKLYEQYSS